MTHQDAVAVAPTVAKPKPGTRKVTVGALSGAVITILAYALSYYEIKVPAEIYAALSTIASTVAVYMTSETYS